MNKQTKKNFIALCDLKKKKIEILISIIVDNDD